MRIINAADLTPLVKRLCIKANTSLPAGVRAALEDFRGRESWPAARQALDRIIENYGLAESGGMPICQDTGAACVFLDIGADVHLEGDIRAAVDEGVRQGCREGYLRMSMAADPLNPPGRVNTGDNTPALLYLDIVGGDRITVTVVPKGAGSENMSRLKMLSPAEGRDGVIGFVLAAVEEAGPNPCPPVVVGVGIGGNFDKAALLAKKALFRPPGENHADPYYAELEAELLRKINALGIGPQGFGGFTTALSVACEKAPTHIASLPCAVNINCHVCRHAGGVL
ncbi:MAG: fumarate hydratase [Treponema sp.]|jgi:fumarate hydratase subunit alpha|nr:fumarate hydratase [Treponema sp.]